eukprot:PITA_03311
MVEKYDSIVRNNVWDVVPRLEDKSVVSSYWIYKVKQAIDGSVKKHKARFLADGFSQVEGIDYSETFALIARIDSNFTMLSFMKSEVNVNLYNIVVEGKFFIIVLYVDGMILESDDPLIKYCKEDLAREFEMNDMGLIHYLLGMEVFQGDRDLIVSQGRYDIEIIRGFCMESSKPMENPLVGNWRKEDATLGEVVEASVYRKHVGSLM